MKVEKIISLRKENNLTIQDVANKLEITRMKYNHYELGNAEPNIEILTKLADIYDTTIDYIVGHKVSYLLDTSALNETQKKLINRIQDLSTENCKRVNDFITGILIAEEEKQQTIQKLKGIK